MAVLDDGDPPIDAGQRDRVHSLVTASVDAPACREEIFGPVAPVTPSSSLDEVVDLACASEHGLSLGVLARDVHQGLRLADRIPSGLVHINDRTVNDEATADVEASTETWWMTLRGDLPTYPS